ATGTVPITQGTDGINKWSFTVDATTFKPDEYIVRVSGVTVDIVDTAIFTVTEAAPGQVVAVVEEAVETVVETTEEVVDVVVETVEEAADAVVETTDETADAVVEAVTDETTQTSPGFGALFALAGLGAVAFVASRKN
ncbi:MAG: PGF-CTERM sorting domain-containing protein, partial [Methanomicrobiales archaeon]|nr:PGF-CTERM sorting domain-containing protein [Methanomicrobiales archaeon]